MAIVDWKSIKELTGIVVSDKWNKTIVVAVNRVRMHPLYKKRFTLTKKYYAHDEWNVARIGDTVNIQEARPMSKLKRRKLVDVVSQTVAK